KRDTHALQHCFGVRSPDELTIVSQSLTSSGSALQLVCLARGTGTIADSGGRLKTYCFLLKNVFRYGRRFCSSGVPCLAATPATSSTAHTSSDVVTDIQRPAKKFRRDVIPLGNQIVALLGERNNSNGIRFHFDFQSRLVGDVTQRFAEWNIIQRNGDA